MRTIGAVAGLVLALLVLWLAAVVVGANSYYEPPGRNSLRVARSSPDFEQQAEPASLTEILANPAAYEGRRVRVAGYLHLEFEDDALYLGPAEMAHFMFRDGIWVAVSDIPTLRQPRMRTRFSDRYVRIEGIFTRATGGGDASHPSYYPGMIWKITSIEALPRRAQLAWRRPILQIAIVPMLMVAVFTAGVAYFAFGLHRRS